MSLARSRRQDGPRRRLYCSLKLLCTMEMIGRRLRRMFVTGRTDKDSVFQFAKDSLTLRRKLWSDQGHCWPWVWRKSQRRMKLTPLSDASNPIMAQVWWCSLRFLLYESTLYMLVLCTKIDICQHKVQHNKIYFGYFLGQRISQL